MEFTLIIIFLSIGLIAGLMSGIFGIGGGSIRIPLLNLAGMPLITAFATNLFAIPFSSSIGAFTQKENIDKRIAVYIIIGGTLVFITGAFLVGFISKLVLAILFVITAIITVFAIYLTKIAPKFAENIHPNRNKFIGISFFLNLITGMRGGSGGSLFPPFLRSMKMNIHEAIATSLFVTIFTAMFAIIVYWWRENIEWWPAVIVLIGSIIGARIGSRMSLKAKPKWLEIGLSILVIILALLTVYKAL